MSLRRPFTLLALLAVVASLLAVSPAAPAGADGTAQALPFSQDWSDPSLITTNDDWSGVPGVLGFLGGGLTGSNDVDPQTVLGTTEDLDVIAGSTSGSNSGGVHEVEADGTIALQGSGSASAPHIVVKVDATGLTGITVGYTLKELDTSDAAQQVALQYRTGGTGDYTNIPAGYVADASNGSGLTTPVSATLPAAADGAADLDIRIITTNASGSDSMIGVDDITISTGATGGPGVPELLLTELVVTPTAGEFIEIHNPGSTPVDLSDVYLTDATFAGGSTYYYNLVTGSNAGGGGFADFLARFPDGASIGAGEYQTVALAGSDGYTAEYAADPTYELFEDGATADAIPDMREAVAGSISDQGGLTNGGEVAILFHWDGDTDLVTDLDYVLWGDKEEGVDKTGVAIDGPDGDGETTTYADDTAIASQDVVSTGEHALGQSFQRVDLDEGNETSTGGNGAQGHDETSEDLGQTWATGTPSPGAATSIDPTPTTLFIHQVQGAGDASPEAGNVVTIEGVVTGSITEGSDTDEAGFFVQEQDAEADADPATSEGIFVHDAGANTLTPGDLVTVTGTVQEQFGMTRITSPTVTVDGTADLPTAATPALPQTTLGEFERYEGMLVTFAQTLYVAEYFNLDRFGEMALTQVATGLVTPSQDTEPGTTAYDDAVDFNARSLVFIDDASDVQNPDPVPFIAAPGAGYTDNRRRGDAITGLTGPLNWSFGDWRVQADPTVVTTDDFTTTIPRPTAAPAVGGTVTVASFNVLNFFETLDTNPGSNNGPDICGPAASVECRGANTSTELDRQLDKTVTSLAELDADIVGLIEIENDGDDTVLDLLVGALNDAVGAGTYDYVATGAVGTDAIRQALIYKPAVVTPVGAPGILDSDAFVEPLTPDDPKNRPAVAQTFTTGADDFTVVVNHLKSKGSGCGAGDDDPQQGSCNATRTAAVTELLRWLGEDSPVPDTTDVLIIGDLNAYAMEDPIDVLVDAGWTNTVHAQDPDAYGYVFDAQQGTLDYSFASASLVGDVTGAAEYGINADEADVIDYQLDFGRDAGYFNGDIPFRASDHDPVLTGLALTLPSNGGGNNGGGDPTEEPTEPPVDPAEGASIREACADDATCTSVTTSQLTFVDGTRSALRQLLPGITATEALIASDEVFADALASGTLQDTRPLLLNSPTELEATVLAELQRLGVEDVWVLGGTAAISDDVTSALAAEGFAVTRLAGATRLETAQEIAEAAGDVQPALVARAFGEGGEGDPTQAFADSLAVGGWAADDGRSVLLSESDQLSGSTAAWLEASASSEATLIGGVAALAEAVASAIAELGFGSARVSGATRFETAVEVATARGFGADAPASTVIISEGQADDAWEGGFSAAAPAAVFDAPILLANGDDLPEPTQAFLDTAVEAGAEVICLASQVACDAAVEAIG